MVVGNKKPTVDGIVTALEVFDQKGELVVTFLEKENLEFQN